MKHFPGAKALERFLVKHAVILFVVQVVIVFALGYVAQSVLSDSEAPGDPQEENGSQNLQAAEESTLWTCSMHPQIRKTGPGKCPLCGMNLIPLRTTAKDKGTSMRQLTVSPAARALMNIQTSRVEKRYVTAPVRMVGKIDYDETRLRHITAWIPGRLDRLYVDYTGVQVKQGDHMVYIYSEELHAEQQVLIDALRSARKRKGQTSLFGENVNLVELTREKLRLWGMTPQQIQEIEQRAKPTDHMTIYAPIGGIVIEKHREEGDRVKVGDRIYTVADLGHLWMKLDAYESDLVWLRYGQRVTFTTEAYPGETFEGKIAFIDPVLNPKTRTVKVRVNVPNPAGKLKPEMFVRAVVRAGVAGGGRVIDANLAGKWIGPMHPEIVKDHPGKCDICGMPLVRAESFGYVTSEIAESTRPLVIPVTAALVTGTRAVVYIEMPSQPRGLKEAYQALGGAIEVAKTQPDKMSHVRAAFRLVGDALTQPNEKLLTTSARRLWSEVSAPLEADVEKGSTLKKHKDAEKVFASLTENMELVRSDFADPNEPTFEGREIVLGPRAGDYYLVKHGLQEGQLVVTRGNFKIDSEIQLQAKPSMMTPQGGGGGGHHHGGHGGAKSKKKAGPSAAAFDLPVTVRQKLQQLNAAYKDVATALKSGNQAQIRAEFAALGEVLDGVDGKLLTGHAKMQWKEFAMLLGNDVAEGRDVARIKDARRVFESLEKTMRRVDAQFGLSHAPDVAQRLDVSSEFQSRLAGLWRTYLTIGDLLAGDNFEEAKRAAASLERTLGAVDMKLLTDARSHTAWMRELSNLRSIQNGMATADDLQRLRGHFQSLSGEMQVLALTFGFGDKVLVYQLHCPMAFGNQGAIWLQKDAQARNPYLGSIMPKCADRVELIAGAKTK